MTQDNQPFVSIIIPVFNDLERLKKCLKSLSIQTYPSDKYEIIVIDNGSDIDPIFYASEFSRVIFAKENILGSYSARNKGVEIANGEIFGFTDSDCLPYNDWIEQGVKRYLCTDNCGLIAGKIEIIYENPNIPTLIEMYERVSAFPQKKYVEQRSFGATANIFTNKDIFTSVGLFNARLKSGGDREWGERVAKAGYSIIYADEVCVQHPARKTFQELHRKMIRQTSGMLDIDSSTTFSVRNTFISVKNWLAYILPSPRILGNIYYEESINGLFKKFQIVLLMCGIKFLRLYESIRLVFGVKEKKY